MKLSRPGPCGPAGTPRISRPFKQLSRSRGQVTHVILTRSPLNPAPKTGAGPFDLHVLSTPPAFVLSQDQTLQTKPNPNPNQPPRRKPETSPGQYNRSRRKNNPEPNPTPPTTPQPPARPRRPTPETRRTREAPDGKNNTRKPPPQQAAEETGHNPTPTTTQQEPGDARTPNPATDPDHSQNRTTQEPGARRRTPDPPPNKKEARHPGAPNPEPRNPPQPATHPNNRSRTNEKHREPQKPEKTRRTSQNNPPKKRETPTPPPKPRTQNMTHYRDLKQHTHRDSTIRIRGPPPPGSARGASVSRTSEADSGPEPAVTGLLRLSSPRPPSGHWISPSPLGPERTLRTGGEAVKPRDGEPAHNAGPPSCPSCPGRFFAPAPRQGRRATARVRRPLRTSTTPPASSCSWAIGASSSSTLTLLR